MNSLIQEEFPLHETQSLRYDLMNTLTDADLTYKLPGDHPTLGELCREMGELEHNYVESFKTRQHDWSYRNTSETMGSSVNELTAWYKTLDAEFETVLSQFSDDELHNSEINRGDDIRVSPHTQFEIYREAIMMFYAKASVYLKALQKPVNQQWQQWIG
ncbi:MAG: DinB family protein [Chloroflexota bacterium]